MAVSGLLLLLFAVVHMLGHLQMFGGQDMYNAYAHFLQDLWEVKWPTRIGLLALGIDEETALVDTTGAGDAHSGVFLAALADGLPVADAARRANAAAALAVTRSGPATSPDRAELDGTINTNRSGKWLKQLRMSWSTCSSRLASSKSLH